MLENLLRVGINLSTKISKDQLNQLIKKEAIACLALKRFLAMEISLSDYLEILELCHVDIDNYLQTVDDNCVLVV